MFKKGDYIVTLKVKDDNGYCNCARNNYCFKQRDNQRYIRPCMDLSGSNYNGHGVMSFYKKESLQDWRYATPREIEEYDKLGKPFDVTKIKIHEVQYEIY